MLNQNLIDDIAHKIQAMLAASPVTEVEQNLRGLLQNFFASLNLVTREEFDVQVQVLARTREMLEATQKRLAELEQQIQPRS